MNRGFVRLSGFLRITDYQSLTKPFHPDPIPAGGGEVGFLSGSGSRDCPCCGDTTAFNLICTIRLAKPVSYPGDEALRVGTCGVCGMGYSEDGVTQDALDTYYAESAKYADLAVYSKPAVVGSLEAEAPWELERSQSLVRFAESHISKSEFVLDIGCSTGTALMILRDDGYQKLGGIDPLAASVRIAREGRQLDVIGGRFGTPHPTGRPDVVLVSHVLEHVLDVHRAIEALADSLEVGGRVVVEVPDASRFHEHVYAPFQDFNTEHINHFSLPHLHALMASHGFEELSLEEALVRSGPHHIYPVARGIWQYTGQKIASGSVVHDGGTLREALGLYVNTSEEIFRRIDANVQRDVSNEPFVIWGAGQFAMKLIRRPGFPLKHCIGIVDSSPSRLGLQIDQFTVGRPEDLRDSPPSVVLTGSIFGAESIAIAVLEMGLNSRVVPLSH